MASSSVKKIVRPTFSVKERAILASGGTVTKKAITGKTIRIAKKGGKTIHIPAKKPKPTRAEIFKEKRQVYLKKHFLEPAQRLREERDKQLGKIPTTEPDKEVKEDIKERQLIPEDVEQEEIKRFEEKIREKEYTTGFEPTVNLFGQVSGRDNRTYDKFIPPKQIDSSPLFETMIKKTDIKDDLKFGTGTSIIGKTLGVVSIPPKEKIEERRLGGVFTRIKEEPVEVGGKALVQAGMGLGIGLGFRGASKVISKLPVGKKLVDVGQLGLAGFGVTGGILWGYDIVSDVYEGEKSVSVAEEYGSVGVQRKAYKYRSEVYADIILEDVPTVVGLGYSGKFYKKGADIMDVLFGKKAKKGEFPDIVSGTTTQRQTPKELLKLEKTETPAIHISPERITAKESFIIESKKADPGSLRSQLGATGLYQTPPDIVTGKPYVAGGFGGIGKSDRFRFPRFSFEEKTPFLVLFEKQKVIKIPEFIKRGARGSIKEAREAQKDIFGIQRKGKGATLSVEGLRGGTEREIVSAPGSMVEFVSSEKVIKLEGQRVLIRKAKIGEVVKDIVKVKDVIKVKDVVKTDKMPSMNEVLFGKTKEVYRPSRYTPPRRPLPILPTSYGFFDSRRKPASKRDFDSGFPPSYPPPKRRPPSYPGYDFDIGLPPSYPTQRRPPSYPPSRRPPSYPPISPPTTIPGIVTFKRLRFDTKSIFGKPLKQPRMRTPSLEASARNIFGKAPKKKLYTGLEFRPLIKSKKKTRRGGLFDIRI